MTTLGGMIPSWLHMLRARKGPVLVHRVDGVPKLNRGHETRADQVQPAANRLTDHTIFQTMFCRTSFAEECGLAPKSWRIIKNAADPRVFFPNPNVIKKDGPLRLAAVSWSSNPRKGFATIADVSRLPGVEVTFVGNWCPEVDPANVRLSGVLMAEELAEVLRSSHAMLHAAWNEPCSNAIVEAMACGLPIVYRDSGGNRELAGDYGVPLTDDLSEVIEALLRDYSYLRQRVLQERELFLINRAAEEYMSMFRYAIADHQIA